MCRWQSAGLLFSMAFLFCNPCLADWPDTERLNRNWQKIDERQKRNEGFWKKQPGEFQKPGVIQQPGAFQDVGEFRKALSEGKVIKQEQLPCQRRFCVGSDTLFNFDQSSLTPYAEEALRALGPMILKLGAHPVKIEGHTDSEGTDEYNQRLSEKRAERVKNWLLQNHFIPAGAEMIGYGESKPKAPNKKPDGSDNPEGRALNRRVEIIVDTCTALNPDASDSQATAATVNKSDTTPKDAAGAGNAVDLAQLLPYADLFSSDEIRKGFARIHVRPLNNAALAFEVLAPSDWEETPLELTGEQLAKDSMAQIPLVDISPKDQDDVHLEVKYTRVPEDTSLSTFMRSFVQKNGFEILGRQPGEFNGRQVEDALLRSKDSERGTMLTRCTVSRHAERVFIVSSSCPEKDYSHWKKVFAAAAVSFTPDNR